ncbi:ATP-dependent DNA helicase pcrA [Wickerhamomyces ciferrii]|uniref:DNA 3'-5' helicase n=1 Tax=Wickerhamomyces ciferrii (strain ATCC 14091 / BCRC 22168 / CBS 111 / JCM 3599 / NBRC 0793 / NRRL Y-1031 F-60-10) TaxID=1206466 RepID=K0KHL2_WICCF|nr:ATP-dependent DNA helicase pcrA [Wickerhamomyces ciferrii]CCH40653.1 ATP-dependent DNA helicase pcrA [Wickerhamomyces ciferrii]
MIEYNIRPETIIVTTFTKKAANEMKERLASMLENTNLPINRLIIGTFHSICNRILHQYGHVTNLQKFKIAADRDWNHIMNSVIDPITEDVANIRDLVKIGKLESGEFLPIERSQGTSEKPYDLKSVKKQISKLKSKGLYPNEYQQQRDHNKELYAIFTEFQNKLEAQKMMDFDDLLIKTNQLLKEHNVLSKINHVLVDEFQDTNTIQLELVSRFAKGNSINNNCITVVGDPDQSIYRFRDAVSINFDLMRKLYPECDVVQLNQNYRSTSGVLDLSEALMTQQEKRIGKSLISSFQHDFSPVYKTHDSKEDEAVYIANEIKYLRSLPGLFDYSDFSILVRAAYQSRALEKALVERKIPYKIVKGKAFWERKEVEMIIDLLRMVAYDDDKPALLRTLQSQTSGIGPVAIKKIDAILEAGIKNGESVYATLNKIGDGEGEIKGISPKIQNLIKGYTNLINDARLLAISESVELDALVKVFDYFTKNGALNDLLLNDEERKQNVTEVKNQLIVFEPIEDEILDLNDEIPVELEDEEETLLQSFLSSIQLYSTHDKEGAGNDGEVCISTIHSAKGLEWPVVFVPGLTEGSLPAGYATKDADDEEALNEERRIFYVATTRSQQLLYITTPLSGGPGWSDREVEPSRFISSKKVQKLMRDNQEALQNWDNVNVLYQSFDKSITDESGVKKVLKDYKEYWKRKNNEGLNKDTYEEDHSYDYPSYSTFKRRLSFLNDKRYHSTFAKPQIEDSKPLPPPGVKTFAPKTQIKINSITKHTPSNNIHKINHAPIFKQSLNSSSSKTTTTASSITKINTTINRASTTYITTVSSGNENPPKRKKTLGVRRRF